MNYSDWNFIYEQIASDLKLNKEKDMLAARILNKMFDKIKMTSLGDLKKLIENKEVIVFGAGSSLESSIKKHKKEIFYKIKISADGSTSALLENNIQPDIIVTDLDGKISDQIKSNNEGSIVVIHAHGDNIPVIEKHFFEFKEKIIGTTQIDPEPFENLYNFGGFTDGDRAVFIADFFNAKKIFLSGFDFDGSIGKYSFPTKKDKNLKIKKLKWCKYLLEKINEYNKNVQEL